MTDNEKEELIHLLNSRNDLYFDNNKWDKLFSLLNKALFYVAAKRVSNTSDDVSDIISDFLIEKIMNTHNSFNDIPYFIQSFKNFCSDRYRSSIAQKRGGNITESYDAKLENHYGESGSSSFDKVSLEIKKELENLGMATEQLNPSNIKFTDEDIYISESAKEWLEKIEAEEGEWVTAYLGIHICPTDVSKTLNTLGKKMNLKSYDHKARKLGITGSKQGFWKGYKKTFIGKWMLQLGIPVGEEPITEEIQSNMLNSLKILCEVALLRVTDPIYQKLLS